MEKDELPTVYKAIGGEKNLKLLVDRFYDLMDTMPDYQVIRKMHPADLSSSREKLFMFLSGWMGGPGLYMEKYGHPRLRGRHLPFPIDITERDQWLQCMWDAMQILPVVPEIKQEIFMQLGKIADFMRNK